MEKEKVVIKVKDGAANLTDYEKAVREFSFDQVEKEFSWYRTGKVNLAYEAVDRQVDEMGRGERVALYYWDGVKEEEYTYARMKELSDRFAGVLRKYGIKKGDRVGIFMPRCPELYISFLGTLKAGGVVIPLFEAFMEDAIRERLGDSGAVAVVTVPELLPRIPREDLPALQNRIVLVEGEAIDGAVDWRREVDSAEGVAEVTWVDREAPSFILYASGADGRPKGLVHVHGAMTGYWITGLWVHDLKEGDVYWCTADPGWITGIVYGFLTPWLHGAPVVVRGGRFDAAGWCETLAKYRVSVWYSAPTAFRMLMAGGDALLSRYDLSRLRHILSVGEPLTREILEWSTARLGQPIYDSWWMSETGMNIICGFRCLDVKPGSIGRPFPGIEAGVVDDDGKLLPPGKIGNLAIRAGWPAMARSVWNNREKYEDYFKIEPWFISGDAAYQDGEGYFYFQGRLDGVINTAGERVGPSEVEDRLTRHPAVTAAGVAGKPDPLRGEIVKAYIVLREGITRSGDLSKELREYVKNGLAAHAAPREFEVVASIPLTRDGKVDRRVLREWVLGLEKAGSRSSGE